MAELLPTGTVTLLLADVEGSTQLWESQTAAMTNAIVELNRTVDELVAEHGGVRPVEQGEGDSFVAAFARAGDAVACAWICSAPSSPRSGCGSACTPATCNCATKATTRGRRSTRPHGCAIWRTAVRRCCRGLPRTWSKTSFPTRPG